MCGLANDLSKHNQILVLKKLNENFHNLISSANVLFCETTEECFNSTMCQNPDNISNVVGSNSQENVNINLANDPEPVIVLKDRKVRTM